MVVPLTAIKAVCFGIDPAIYENDRRISGAIFCHVDRIKQFIHDSDVITDGNHIWHGAAPNLRSKEVIKIIIATLFLINVLISIDDPSKSSIDPRA